MSIKTITTSELVADPRLKAAYPDDEERSSIVSAFDRVLNGSKTITSEKDRKRITAAFIMAAIAHKDIRRKSGEAYILHPIAVAQIVEEEINLDATSIICALLHDVVEDTDTTLLMIEKEFGNKVSSIVDGLTKIKGLKNKQVKMNLTGEYRFEEGSMQAENYKKILLTIGEDLRVILIKVADRLHNMRTLKSMPEAKQRTISFETMYLYAPIAHRFGLYQIKSELEDLSLKYTNRVIYKQIANKLAEKKTEREAYIKEFITPIEQMLKEEGFENFQVYGRPKSIHSILNKIQKKNVEFEEIFDLFAIRIILDPEPDKEIYEFTAEDKQHEKKICWMAYSIITNKYKPNRDRLRDWIDYPKANGYESLHTTVMGPQGKWVEVQIRTRRMHEVAEKGIAAHWKYKEGSSENANALDVSLQKIRDAIKDLAENNDALDFVNDFKHNLYENEVYVFTPKGEVKSLPAGSSVIDFAYSIHTVVGGQCIAAKINAKIHPISTKLKNGDQVEIITSKKQKPSKDWLVFAKTSRARSKIKSALNEEKKRIADEGKEMLMRKLRSFKVPFNNQVLEEIRAYFNMEDSLELLYNIALKNINVNVLKDVTFSGNKIVQPESKKPEVKKKAPVEEVKEAPTSTKSTEFSILDSFPKAVKFTIANCCNPVRDDAVFGIITNQHGIKIHSVNCPNAADMHAKHSHRIVKTKWGDGRVSFMTGIALTGIDGLGLVNKVTTVISEEFGINISGLSFDALDGVFEGTIKVYVQDLGELKKLINRLKKMDGIYTVKRAEVSQ